MKINSFLSEINDNDLIELTDKQNKSLKEIEEWLNNFTPEELEKAYLSINNENKKIQDN
jgi:hypothetical protein